MKIILETKRLLLREMVESDLLSLQKVIHSPDGGPADLAYAKKWLDWCLSSYQKYGFGHLAVIYKESGELIGSAGISMQYIDDDWKPEIGYHLRKDYHRQGLAKEMGIALRDYYFHSFDGDELYCYMEKENMASYKTAEAIGLKYLHLYKEYRVYRLTREEWNRLTDVSDHLG